MLAQRGCHHDNIVVAPRLAADIPALFQILPTALLLLANTNSCSWSHSTGEDISSKIRLNNQQQQATDNSFTATLTTACDTSLTKNIFLKKFIFASLYCNSNFHSVPLFEGPSFNISNLSGPLRCSQFKFQECICRVSSNSSF